MTKLPRALGERPLSVEVPAETRDKPAWVKVGAIAAVGFVVGVAWPRLLGVRPGPSAPGEGAAAASASAQGGRAPDAPPASVVAKAAPPASASAAPAAVAAPAASTATGAPRVSVQKGAVLSCKTAGGETKKGSRECGHVPGLDQLVTPRLRKISGCSGLEGQSGKLSLVVNADFASGKLSYDVGKSSTLTNLDAVASCLKTTFHGTTTASTPHEHPRYTVAYTAILSTDKGVGDGDKDAKSANAKSADSKNADSKNAKEAPPSEKEDKAEAPPQLNSGEAIVTWEVALVRETPKTGDLVSRLPRGTKVKIGTSKEGWYQIRFGDGYAHEGWVYRGAIGR